MASTPPSGSYPRLTTGYPPPRRLAPHASTRMRRRPMRKCGRDRPETQAPHEPVLSRDSLKASETKAVLPERRCGLPVHHQALTEKPQECHLARQAHRALETLVIRPVRATHPRRVAFAARSVRAHRRRHRRGVDRFFRSVATQHTLIRPSPDAAGPTEVPFGRRRQRVSGSHSVACCSSPCGCGCRAIRQPAARQ